MEQQQQHRAEEDRNIERENSYKRLFFPSLSAIVASALFYTHFPVLRHDGFIPYHSGAKVYISSFFSPIHFLSSFALEAHWLLYIFFLFSIQNNQATLLCCWVFACVFVSIRWCSHSQHETSTIQNAQQNAEPKNEEGINIVHRAIKSICSVNITTHTDTPIRWYVARLLRCQWIGGRHDSQPASLRITRN